MVSNQTHPRPVLFQQRPSRLRMLSLWQPPSSSSPLVMTTPPQPLWPQSSGREKELSLPSVYLSTSPIICPIIYEALRLLRGMIRKSLPSFSQGFMLLTASGTLYKLFSLLRLSNLGQKAVISSATAPFPGLDHFPQFLAPLAFP